jgi:hypothetical protein
MLLHARTPMPRAAFTLDVVLRTTTTIAASSRLPLLLKAHCTAELCMPHQRCTRAST